jgi:hypothetical protein
MYQLQFVQQLQSKGTTCRYTWICEYLAPGLDMQHYVVISSIQTLRAYRSSSHAIAREALVETINVLSTYGSFLPRVVIISTHGIVCLCHHLML